jgi:hypothetical protein
MEIKTLLYYKHISVTKYPPSFILKYPVELFKHGIEL